MEARTWTNYKGQTGQEIYRLENKESWGAVSTWTVYEVTKAGRTVGYQLSFYRAGAVSPGDETFKTKQAMFIRLTDLRTSFPGSTLTMFG